MKQAAWVGTVVRLVGFFGLSFTVFTGCADTPNVVPEPPSAPVARVDGERLAAARAARPPPRAGTDSAAGPLNSACSKPGCKGDKPNMN